MAWKSFGLGFFPVCFWFGLCLETRQKNLSNRITFTLDSRQLIYSETIPATFQSFIAQECNTDIKYSSNGTPSSFILPVVRKYIKKLQYKFQLAYFNIKQLAGNKTIDLHHLIKYCFAFNLVNWLWKKQSESKISIEPQNHL